MKSGKVSEAVLKRSVIKAVNKHFLAEQQMDEQGSYLQTGKGYK